MNRGHRERGKKKKVGDAVRLLLVAPRFNERAKIIVKCLVFCCFFLTKAQKKLSKQFKKRKSGRSHK